MRRKGRTRPSPTTTRPRPLSPNVQIYRPQLTSVLSILNRITGIFLSACAVVLAVWLVAAAWGPQAYAPVQAAIASWIGGIVLFGAPFAFFLHLFGGIRHLVWDTVPGFDPRSVSVSGWSSVAVRVVLTFSAWVAAGVEGGGQRCTSAPQGQA